MVRHHRRLAIDYSEFANRVLCLLILVCNWTTHVQRDVHWADLVEQGKVLTDLVTQFVFKVDQTQRI